MSLPFDGTLPDDPAEVAHFDGREMDMVHNALRREFALMPDLVRGVAAGDGERTAIVAGHIRAVGEVLHHHHQTEDDHVWPVLLERSSDAVTPLVRLMEDQHQAVLKAGRAVDDALDAWAGGAGTGENLAGALERLAAVLTEHLTAEEEQVVPLMERHITAAEWSETIRKGAATVDPAVLQVQLGMLMYEGDPEIVDGVFASMPDEIRPAMRQGATEAYAAYAERVHGTATPPRIGGR